MLEEQGIPTANISLIRHHTEKVKPPRSLWVPFELGRPLGVPDNKEFQKKVLFSLLNLFKRTDGPFIIEDFQEDAPLTDTDVEVLSCPVSFEDNNTDDPDQLKTMLMREIRAMHPWYEISLRKRGRTTVGASGIEISSLGEFLYSFVKGYIPENPRHDVNIPVTLKLAAEDLKSYYIEGVTAQPGQQGLSSKALKEWFWTKTVAGKVLLELIKVCSKMEDQGLRMTATHFIAPIDVLMRSEITLKKNE